jgi:arsenite methyltransferase
MLEKTREGRIKEAVKAYYGARAQVVAPSCCGPQACCGEVQSGAQDVATSQSESACCTGVGTESSLGCGNPLAFVGIQEGETVLDLGSGLGLEVILAARIVGDGGRVIGLDMTPEMIDKAKQNAERAGVGHIAEFRLGEMEDMPLENDSVDRIVSNCVVNLSPDKEKVFGEAYRVLKPGGTLLISDLVSSGLPDEVRNDLSSWAQCLGGTLEEAEYLRLMEEAGFDEIAVVDKVDASALLAGSCCCCGVVDEKEQPRVDSISVRAVKIMTE